MKKQHFTIATVAQQTGIAKEVLRKWESRYGFPVPSRDAAGNRLYSVEQTERLKLIKKLLDDGSRPGQVVALDMERLHALAAAPTERQAAVAGDATGDAGAIVAWLQARNPELLRENLQAALNRAGLRRFAMTTVPAMNELVGDAWASGAIAVRDEHLYTEIVQNLLREALTHLPVPADAPRILLTTVPEEAHGLGILLAETVLTLNQARCISLGVQSPTEEILLAAQDYQAQVVALSFSLSFPKRRIVPLLKALRARLPATIGLWAGGAGIAGLERTPRGVALLPALDDAVAALEPYRHASLPAGE